MSQDPIIPHLQWIADSFAATEHAIPYPHREAVKMELRKRLEAIAAAFQSRPPAKDSDHG